MHPAPSWTVVPAGSSNEPRAPTRSIQPSFITMTASASRSPGVATSVTFTMASRRTSTGRIAAGGACCAHAAPSASMNETAPNDAVVRRARNFDCLGPAMLDAWRIRAFHTVSGWLAGVRAGNQPFRSRSRPSMAVCSFSGDS